MLAEVFRNSSKLSKFTQKVVKNLPFNPTQLKRQLYGTAATSNCSNVPRKTYNTPHPPKDPPAENYAPKCLNRNAFQAVKFLPVAVFRPFRISTERLGPDAAKNKCYKNPEYYSYHRYSFVELQHQSLILRNKRIENGGIRCIYDYESDGDEEDALKNQQEPKEKKDNSEKLDQNNSSSDSGTNIDSSQDDVTKIK